ncbi:STE20-related kinase adapter protein alpha [Planococcus citri]|uniref:STE20-related kinase adapter protein alpha n=1 Tax=Planococcus citri TaxID=170843 RepID=UPI0031F97D8E
MLYETGAKFYTTCSVLSNCFFDKGKVLLAKHKSSGSLVAIKHFNLEEISQEQYDLLINEIFYMRQLKHPNVISCLTSYVINFDLYVISPLMNFTSCHDLISTQFQEGLSEIVISYVLRDVLRALDYIHSKGYIHRAIRARHILVHADGHACLSGLRFMYPIPKEGAKVYNFPLHAAHNLNWLSPELLGQNSEGYTEKSDVYSVGVTACELANGIVPFAETSTTLMLTEKVRGVTPQLIDCTTWFLYEDSAQNKEDMQYDSQDIIESSPQMKRVNRKFTESFHAFVELCSHINVAVRPSPKQLLNHSFFKQIRRTNVNLPELLLPAVPYTESNITELNEDVAVIDDLTYNFHDINVCQKEWDFS